MTLNDNPLAMAQSRYNVLLKRRQRLHSIKVEHWERRARYWALYTEVNKQMDAVMDLIRKIRGKPFTYPWSQVVYLKQLKQETGS